MPKKVDKYAIIGLMSGTSLDGLDIAHCIFELENKHWSFEIAHSTTVSYPEEIKQALKESMHFSKDNIELLDIVLGKFIGEKVTDFIVKNNIEADYIASHGHTVLHQPNDGITLQIGNGSEIGRITGVSVINNFRTKDVELGGQGAPLVPIGDKLLFSKYDFCINLGGIANISFDDKEGIRRAFDICGCNLLLNDLSKVMGKEYDENGKIAQSGRVDKALLEKLMTNNYLEKPYPKSLGKEDLWKYDKLCLDNSELVIEDKMATYVEYVAVNITKAIGNDQAKILFTGGGTFNKYLIKRIIFLSSKNNDIVVPNKITIDYKEALIFAFLGVLRIRKEINVLSSVTGASKDSCSGVML